MIPMVWKVGMRFEGHGVVRSSDGSVFLDLIASAEFFENEWAIFSVRGRRLSIAYFDC
jgi:hypothetical protein